MSNLHAQKRRETSLRGKSFSSGSITRNWHQFFHVAVSEPFKEFKFGKALPEGLFPS